MPKTLIIYFGRYGFASAGTKRVRQFALGLREAGDDPAVLGYRRCERGESREIEWRRDAWDIEYAGVPITAGRLSDPRRLRDILTLGWRVADAAMAAVRRRGFDRVVVYGQSWLGLGAAVRRLSAAGLPVVADLNEWWLWRGMLPINAIEQKLFRALSSRRLAGIIGISDFWWDFARRIDRPMIRIPAMGDEEFTDIGPSAADAFHLVYVGVLFRRDLPQTLLCGVRLALQRGHRVHLTIVGRTGLFPEAVKAANIVRDDPLLRDHVTLAGWVERDELTRIYSRAAAFVLLRDNDWETRACFPTRLPEFLATARPVITSDATDVAQYLKHGVEAWLVPPGDRPEALADAIGHLASHRDEAQRIGRAGAEAARREFSYRVHGRRLKDFLDGLQRRR